jgi:hypothetical protein
MTSWNLAAFRAGHSRTNRSPVVGATAPETSNQSKVCWTRPTGWTSPAVSRRRRTVRHPTRRSSWRHTRTGRVCADGMVHRRSAAQVACNAGMAAGVLCMTGPRDLACGLEARANKRGERVIVALQMMGLRNPLVPGCSGGQPGRLSESLLHCRQYLRRARERRARRHR